jgi:hypothetical protein
MPRIGGRAKGTRNKATEFIRPIAQRYGPEIIEKLHRLALYSKTESTIIKAGELVLAYAYGKPPQSMEIGGIGGGPLRISSPDEKKQALDAILQQVAGRVAESESVQ